MDLSLIAEEIKNRKKERGEIAEQAGIDIPTDNFLHSLQQSLASGHPNKATAKLKVVNERSENMVVKGPGEGVINNNPHAVNEDVLRNVNPQPSYTANPNPNVNPNVNPNYPQNNASSRDEQFYKNLNETKQILGNNEIGMVDAMAMYQKQQPNQQPMITNPNYLTEQVNNAVHTYMQTNIAVVVEAAVKNTMMEMYQKEKIETALNENKEMIQKIVVETILALKKRNTQKK